MVLEAKDEGLKFRLKVAQIVGKCLFMAKKILLKLADL